MSILRNMEPLRNYVDTPSYLELYNHLATLTLKANVKYILTIKIATKQANVVFQSPYDEALPTNTP